MPGVAGSVADRIDPKLVAAAVAVVAAVRLAGVTAVMPGAVSGQRSGEATSVGIRRLATGDPRPVRVSNPGPGLFLHVPTSGHVVEVAGRGLVERGQSLRGAIERGEAGEGPPLVGDREQAGPLGGPRAGAAEHGPAVRGGAVVDREAGGRIGVVRHVGGDPPALVRNRSSGRRVERPADTRGWGSRCSHPRPSPARPFPPRSFPSEGDSVVPPTPTTLGLTAGHDGVLVSPDEATKVTPAWPLGVVKWLSRACKVAAPTPPSPLPQLIETTEDAGDLPGVVDRLEERVGLRVPRPRRARCLCPGRSRVPTPRRAPSPRALMRGPGGSDLGVVPGRGRRATRRCLP